MIGGVSLHDDMTTNQFKLTTEYYRMSTKLTPLIEKAGDSISDSRTIAKALHQWCIDRDENKLKRSISALRTKYNS